MRVKPTMGLMDHISALYKTRDERAYFPVSLSHVKTQTLAFKPERGLPPDTDSIITLILDFPDYTPRSL